MAWIKAPEIIFYTDFNSVGDDGRLFSPLSALTGPLTELRVGGAARVADHEGNSVLAFIHSVQDRYVTLDPEWKTWVDGSAFQLVDHGRFSDAVTTAGTRSLEFVA